MQQTSRADPPAAGTQIQAQHCVVEGLPTRYLHRGGPPSQHGRASAPILILHGWGANIDTVASIVAALEGLGDVYALDLPGFGQTQLPPEPWGVADYQRFLASFMDFHRIECASLVAHSNGGRIAIRMAATEPDRVEKLVLIDSAGIRPRHGFSYHRKVAMAKAGKHAARLLGAPGERLRTWLVGKAASSDYASAGALRPTFVKLVNEDLRSFLPDIKASTLLIWGSNDTATPLADAQLMEHQIPDAGLVVLEGAGHYSYLDQPGRFGTIVRHFLGGPMAPELASEPAP